MDKNSLFEEIYQDNFSYVYNLIYMRVLHKETAEEICSDVFMRAYRSIESFDSEKAGARTWLCAIARNLLINYYKNSAEKKLELMKTLPETPVEDEYAVLKQGVNNEVRKLLGSISEAERELISLRYMMELSIKDIAELKGTTPNAMTHKIGRIIEKLRRMEEASGKKLSDFI